MEREIRALLVANAEIAVLCGGRVDYGAQQRGEPLPAIILNIVSDRTRYSLDGASGLAEARLQVDCYAESYSEAKGLSHAALAVLSGHRGGLLEGVFHAGSRDMRDTDAVGEAAYRVSMDFHVHYQR